MTNIIRILCAALVLAACLFSESSSMVPAPGARVVIDAHNCYPYNGRWGDRITRAISAGLPVAIEQDLFWYSNPAGGAGRSILSHGKPVDGTEPSMRDYFFERIRPIMEQALKDGNKGDWPLITLNLDFKTDEPAHHAEIWNLLGEYEAWLCTAERVADPSEVTPLKPGPLLVLTGEADSQEQDFHNIVPVGGRLRLFGAVHTGKPDASIPPDRVVLGKATNYRRWWNNPWRIVEQGGQAKAGAWNAADEKRLRSLVDYAHHQNLWIRFYTLDGDTAERLVANGWDRGYNFGSRRAVEARWKAAIAAGVDYIATDQYEELADSMRSQRSIIKSWPTRR